MKILMVGTLPKPISPKTTGGVANVVLNLSKKLSDIENVEVYILATNVPHKNYPKWTKYKDDMYFIGKYTKQKPLDLIDYFGFSKMFKTIYRKIASEINYHLFGKLRDYRGGILYLQLQEIIDEIKPDIIHAHHAHANPIASYLASNGEIPIITTVHSFHKLLNVESKKEKKYTEEIYKKNFEISKGIIVNSPYIKKRAIELNCNISKIEIIPNGIDLDYWEPIKKEKARKLLNLNPHSRIILFTGNLEKRKGVDILLKSFKELLNKTKEKDIRLLIVGSGKEEKKLKKMVNSLNLIEYVIFTGRVSQNKLKLLYDSCDLYCAPSIAEAFGLVYLEAMACGKPVIGPNVQGPKFIIDNGESGLTFQRNNFSDLAKKINKLLESDNLRKKLGKNAINVVNERFSWDKISSETLDVYKEIVKNQRCNNA